MSKRTGAGEDGPRRGQFDLGSATIRPRRPVVAGSYVTLTYTYTAGHPVDDSGYVKIVFRHVGDFGAPQFTDPAAADFCSVRTTGECIIVPRWDEKGHTRPWSRALYLQVKRGYLDRGQKIIVTFGDESAGSPGWRVQTFCESTWEFRTLVDPIATYEFKQLDRSPELRVIAGDPVRAVCLGPSQVTVGRPFEYWLRLEDRWGNATGKCRRLRHRGFSKRGVRTVMGKDAATRLRARSNPIEVRLASEQAPLNRYWADFHGQSEETIGTNTIEDYFTFARDVSRLDICSHQGNDFQVTDEFWARINRTTRAFYRPGRFVTFPGYEWSGNTPLGGDRNVYFASEGGKISRSCRDLIGGVSKYPDSPTAADLFATLRAADGPAAFGFAHVGGRYADIAAHDERIELAVEVHSAWGAFQWLVDEALARGYRIGICANSDGHKCRPGASYPGATEFGSYGGLTCVLAPRLDRRSVLAALRKRRFYATTGHRPLVGLRLLAADGREAQMGDEIDAGGGGLTLAGEVTGAAPIEYVEVRVGPDVVETLRPYGRDDLGRRIKVVWSGAEVRGRDRRTAWDGGLRLISNTIAAVEPINFLRADRPLERIGRNRLTWRSATTGGVAGVIITLARPSAGRVEIDTVQRRVRCLIKSIGLRPRIWDCGGLAKQLAVYRLPDDGGRRRFRFAVPLDSLPAGEHAVYVRIVQEDGHMAWTSPVYVTRTR